MNSIQEDIARLARVSGDKSRGLQLAYDRQTGNVAFNGAIFDDVNFFEAIRQATTRAMAAEAAVKGPTRSFLSIAAADGKNQALIDLAAISKLEISFPRAVSQVKDSETIQVVWRNEIEDTLLEISAGEGKRLVTEIRSRVNDLALFAYMNPYSNFIYLNMKHLVSLATFPDRGDFGLMVTLAGQKHLRLYFDSLDAVKDAMVTMKAAAERA